jgi:hypothetical protein
MSGDNGSNPAVKLEGLAFTFASACLEDSPVVTSLDQYLIVVIFVAGFAVADFGSFDITAWRAVTTTWLGSEAEGGAYSYVHLVLMF